MESNLQKDFPIRTDVKKIKDHFTNTVDVDAQLNYMKTNSKNSKHIASTLKYKEINEVFNYYLIFFIVSYVLIFID